MKHQSVIKHLFSASSSAGITNSSQCRDVSRCHGVLTATFRPRRRRRRRVGLRGARAPSAARTPFVAVISLVDFTNSHTSSLSVCGMRDSRLYIAAFRWRPITLHLLYLVASHQFNSFHHISQSLLNANVTERQTFTDHVCHVRCLFSSF